MNINPLYNDLSKFDIVKIKTNKPPLCEICGEEMEKVFLLKEPKCGKKKIVITGARAGQVQYKYKYNHVTKKVKVETFEPPEGITYRKRGRDKEQRSVVRGAGKRVLVNGGTRYSSCRRTPVWDGESWICRNDSPEHDRHDLEKKRLKIPFFKARKQGLLKKDNNYDS